MAVMSASTVTSLPNQAVGLVECRHCGDRCGADACRTKAGTFCCAGCEAVYSLLANHELTGFYACDLNPGRSQKASSRRDPDRFAVLDDPTIASRFVKPVAPGTVRATFAVPAIHCASCIWLLERLWRFDAGVGRSEADVLSRSVRVEFDPDRTSLRAIAELVASLGYEPVLDPEQTDSVPAERRTLYMKLGVAGFAFGNVMLFSIPRYLNGAPLEPAFQRLFDVLNLIFTVPVLLYSASDYMRGAWRALTARHITLDVPIAIGLIVLFGRSVVDISQSQGPGFLDSFAGLVFFLLIGRLIQQKAFERIAFDRSVRSFLPLAVHVERGVGTELTPVDRLEPGDIIRLRSNEVVPADALLIDEQARVDNAFITGEQVPVSIVEGERVSAGGRLVGRAARFRIERPASRTRLAELWANPVFDRPKATGLHAWSSRFGLWFTVAAVALAVAGAAIWWPDVRTSAEVATAVLIIACPCALTLAAPIAVGTAMGALGRAGLFLKQSAVALDLSRVDTVVFDKTGTLTTARAEPETHAGADVSTTALVQALAAHSTHPVSRAIAGPRATDMNVECVEEHPGLGVTGRVNGRQVAIGSAPFISAQTGHELRSAAGTSWFSVDCGEPRPLLLPTTTRPAADTAVAVLSRRFETWLLSGDHAAESASVWRTLFGDRLRFGQSPEDKLAAITSLEQSGRRVLMIGDGLNDAGALAAATVGIAVSDETACLVPSCDAVLDGTRVQALPELIAYARRVPRVVRLCFAVSIAYNFLGIGFALAGALTPLVTAILMPVSSMTVVALSSGLMRLRAPEAIS